MANHASEGGADGDEVGPAILGRVAFYDSVRGYGSIHRESDGATIWLSKNALRKSADGVRATVEDGDLVEFKVKPQRPDQRFPTALDVHLADVKATSAAAAAPAAEPEESEPAAASQQARESTVHSNTVSPATHPTTPIGLGSGGGSGGGGGGGPAEPVQELHLWDHGLQDPLMNRQHHAAHLSDLTLPASGGAPGVGMVAPGTSPPMLPVDTVWNVPLPRTTVLTNTIINAVREMEEAYREREAELEAREKALLTREKRLKEKTRKAEGKLKEGEIRVSQQVRRQLEQAKEECEGMRAQAQAIVEKAMESARKGAVEELAAARKEIANWESEKKRISKAHKFNSEKIVLDVGGRKFSTTRDTLVGPSAEGTALAAMFSGRHALRADKDGTVLIDRDGRAFQHILNYLRSPEDFQVPHDEAEYQQLLLDAEFYRMPQALFEKLLYLDSVECTPSFAVGEELVVSTNDNLSYHVQEHCIMASIEMAGCIVPCMNVNTHVTITPTEPASCRFDFGAVARVTLDAVRFRFFFRGFYENAATQENWNVRLQGKCAGLSDWIVLMEDSITVKSSTSGLGSLFATGVVVTAPIYTAERVYLDEVVLELETEEESGTISVYGVEFFGTYQLLREVHMMESRWRIGAAPRDDAQAAPGAPATAPTGAVW
mmetsp:Transcript_2752/g.9728  ORF Transcript_2752/g.9728 Transcript_2752/m.9728 type:complete len:661 (+) Transcript_2752:204-2186(+)